jgi:hypothetical protein
MFHLLWVSFDWSKSLKKVRIQYELSETKLAKLTSMKMYMPISWVILHNLILIVRTKNQVLVKEKGGSELDIVGN